MFATTPLPALRRVSRREPCPICESTDWCEIREDGAVHCMRVESDVAEEHRGGGWWHRTGKDGGRGVGAGTPILTAPGAAPPVSSIASSPAVADQVYRQILAQSPLSLAHRAYLERAGILPGQMEHYGTFTRISKQFENISKDDILTVPGFYQDDLFKIKVNLKRDSLIVGVSDADGQIVGLQVRKDAGGYYWLSSRDRGGTSPGAPPHVATGSAGDALRVWLTEGVKKADVTATHTGSMAIGLAGHGSQRDLAALLTRLRDAGTDVVVIAFDQDADEHKRALVAQSTQKAAACALSLGLAVRLAVWDGARAKGIDDLFLAGLAPELVPIAAALVNPDGSLTPVGEDLNAQIKLKAVRSTLAMDADPTTKYALIVQWLTCGFPGCGHAEPCPLVNAEAGKLMGCSTNVAGRTLRALADSGLSARTTIHKLNKDGKPYTILEYAPTRLPAPGEQVTPAQARSADRDRKRRCVECGSEHLVTRTICTACGTVQPEENNVDVSVNTESVVHINREGVLGHTLNEETTPVNTDSVFTGPGATLGPADAPDCVTTESVSTATFQESCPPGPLPTRPDIPSLLDSGAGNGGVGVPAMEAPSPAEPRTLTLVEYHKLIRPASDPRPWWRCDCGYVAWSHHGQEHWYCSNCGENCLQVGVP